MTDLREIREDGRRLAAIYEEAKATLAVLLLRMLDQPEAKRFRVFVQIERVLERLRAEGGEAGTALVEKAFRFADAKVRATLKKAGQLRVSSFEQVNEQAVQAAGLAFTRDMETALQSVHRLASRILRRSRLEDALDQRVRARIAEGLASLEAREGIVRRARVELERSFQKGVVQITARNGRLMSFDLPYYANMVAGSTVAQAMTAALVTRAVQNDNDLVRVSPNPSTTNDFCDAYAGRVFSISGDDARFPRLDETPNGGPPFHPHCKHSVGIFIEQFYSPSEVEEFRDIDREFLLHAGEDSASRIHRAFKDHGAARPVTA